MKYITSMFAQTYGAGTYGSNAYQATASNTGNNSSGTGSETSSGSGVGQTAGATTATTTAANPSGKSTSGLLSNTGFDAALVISAACFIIFATLVIRFWRKPATYSAKSN